MNESELNDLLSCPFCGMPAVGPELGNIRRQMAEIEKLAKQTWYP